jgi:ParB-like chromosome segregation protein Spo0J
VRLLRVVATVRQEEDPAETGVEVPVRNLRSGYSPRRAGVDPQHVDLLIETGGNWPPLLVQRSTLRLIDGAHRLAAAKALGQRTVRVVFFEGDDDEAIVEAIRANRDHGLPLSAADRKAAAGALLVQSPHWSDGRIAAVCSLSPKTVAELRRRRSAPPGASPVESLDARIRLGRDGRRRPVSSSEVRARIREAIAADPSASLRVLAVRAGASPETVRRVRREGSEQTSSPDSNDTSIVLAPRPLGPLPTIDPEVVGSQRARDRWSRDTACASTPEGARFATWFDSLDIEEAALWEFSGVIPTSRLYEVIDETHRRARFWAAFADRLERRIRREPS